MVRIRIPRFNVDPRGNRLLAVETREVMGHPELMRLYARGADSVARHVAAFIEPLGAVADDIRSDEHEPDWTHRWNFAPGWADSVWDGLDLLKEVLTLDTPRGSLNLAIALDFYKAPDSHEDPKQWDNTDAGELAHRAKYWTGQRQQQARIAIGDRLATVIRRHPLMLAADAVVSVPGHVSTGLGNGERIAALTAQRAELPFVRTTARHDKRPAAKNMSEAFDLTDEFAVPLGPEQSKVIIVDDTFHTGSTMAAVAAAARRSGATTVYGLVCARTMKT